jgi:hypothetical protein
LSFLKKNVVFSSDAPPRLSPFAPSEADVFRFSLFSVDAPRYVNENSEFSGVSSNLSQETRNDAARSPSRVVFACRYFNRFNYLRRFSGFVSTPIHFSA